VHENPRSSDGERTPSHRPAVGVLLANTGSPDAPTTAAVRRYLAQFLADRRVVDLPRLPWWLIRNLVILPLRSPRSARLYRRVWGPRGSPLVTTMTRLAGFLGETLRGATATRVEVEVGMRYGQPSIAAGLCRLAAGGCERILVLPLFPQYSSATTASVCDAVWDELKGRRRLPELRILCRYHDHPAYIEAVAGSVGRHWSDLGRGERLLISFHGLPVRYTAAGDPYADECTTTARLVADRLELEPQRWTRSYQSRFGREAWLEPATDQLLRAWAREGLDQVDVVCPGFAVDCLETLEEIAMTGADMFAASGGGDLRYVPALNDSAAHVEALSAVCVAGAAGWLG